MVCVERRPAVLAVLVWRTEKLFIHIPAVLQQFRSFVPPWNLFSETLFQGQGPARGAAGLFTSAFQ